MNGRKQLVNAQTGLCLNVEGAQTANLSTVIAYTCSPSSPFSNEQWTISAAAGGATPSYSIKGIGSNRCLNVPQANRADGTGLVIWDCSSLPNDTWSVVTTFKTEIKVRAYVLADDDGITRAPTVTETEFRTYLSEINPVFARAGVYFTLDHADWINTNNTLLNTMTGDPFTPVQEALARMFASGNSGYVTVFLRYGPTLGSPHQGGVTTHYVAPTDFVVVPNQDFAAQVLLHEFGHYFSLGHTMNEARYPDGVQPNETAQPPQTIFNANDVAAAFWWNHGATVNAFDADLVSDTPPDPGPWSFQRRWALAQSPPVTDPAATGMGACLGDDQIDITWGTGGPVVVTAYPDRYNAMSYFKACWHAWQQSLSAIQLARVKATLATGHRAHLVRQ
jgi:hypothetical protein